MRIIRTILLSLAIPVFACFALPSFVFSDDNPPKTEAVKNAETPPPKADAEAAKDEQTSYVYDLKKLIEKSKDNIKRVNEKIQEQAIYKRNQQREEKAREYYERAVQLFEEGKVDEARDLWEKSIKITEHPEMKNYIKGSEKRFKLQAEALKKEDRQRQARTLEEQRARDQQVVEAYNTAVTLYKQKKYKQAREEFILVEQLTPEYKATRSYLKLLEQNIAVQDKEEAQNQKKEIARQQEDAEAARVREKEMWRKEIELKEQERRAKLTQQASDVYKQALDLYKKKDFVGAKEKFQEVEWVIPDYKATRKYLDKLDAEIKKHESEFVAQKDKERAQQNWQDELAHKKQEAENKKAFDQKTAEQKRQDAQEAEIDYQAAIKLLTDKNYQDAHDKFMAVENVYPDYKATSTYLSQLNQKLGIIENAPDKVSGDVKGIYAEAVQAYKTKDFAVAKLKFERVEFMYPNYESTRKYLAKLDKDYDIKKAVATSKDEAIKEEIGAASAAAPLSTKTVEGKPVTSEEYDKLVAKVEPMYTEALSLYDAKKYDESFKQFQTIEDTLPNYKSTRPYLKRVNQQIKRIEQQRYKEEQMQQAVTINALAKQANTLFLKIQQLSDDSATSSAKKKFAMVDKLFANLSRDQAKLLAEITEEEQRLKLEDIAYEQEVQKSEFANVIDPIYDEAVRLYQEKRYDEAKAKFLEAQSKLADYRSSSRYLALIEKQNLLLSQVMKDREDKIRDYQARADRDAQVQTKIQLQTKEQGMIKELVAQAESINDEIMTLSKDRNFEAIKAKFADLEKVVDNLLTIKNAAAQREQAEKYGYKKPVAPVKPVAKGQSVEKETPEVKDASDQENAAAIARLTAATSPTPQSRRQQQREKVEEKKRFRAMDKQNRDLYHQAQQDYDNGRLSEAKTKFVALEQQPGYSNASRKYINTIDQIVLKKQMQHLSVQNRDREEFIKDRVERERMTYQVKEAGISADTDNRAVAKTLSQGAVTTAYAGGHGDYLDSLNLRVRRSDPQVASEAEVSTMKEVEGNGGQMTSADQPKPPSPSGMSPNEDASWSQRRKQKELSDKRKKYLDDQYKAAQKAARQEQGIPDVDQLSREQRARELKNRAVYEKELRKTTDAGYERAVAAADLQDKKDHDAQIRQEQELLRQQREEEKSTRSDKERQISTVMSQGQDIEGAPKTDLSALRADRMNSTASGSVPPQPLTEDKQGARKQFDDGVEQMYREALSYYKSGMYKEARNRFEDVEDLSPDYKKTRTYMDRSDKEILKQQPHRVATKDQSSDDLRSVSPAPADETFSPAVPVAKQNAVASALDLYESQQK